MRPSSVPQAAVLAESLKDTVKDVIDKIHESSNGLIQANIDESGNFSISAYKETVDENGEKSCIKDERQTAL